MTAAKRVEPITVNAYRALDFALANIGVCEDRAGSNRGPELDTWARELASAVGSYWCALAVAKARKEGGLWIPPYNAGNWDWPATSLSLAPLCSTRMAKGFVRGDTPASCVSCTSASCFARRRRPSRSRATERLASAIGKGTRKRSRRSRRRTCSATCCRSFRMVVRRVGRQPDPHIPQRLRRLRRVTSVM